MSGRWGVETATCWDYAVLTLDGEAVMVTTASAGRTPDECGALVAQIAEALNRAEAGSDAAKGGGDLMTPIQNGFEADALLKRWQSMEEILEDLETAARSLKVVDPDAVLVPDGANLLSDLISEVKAANDQLDALYTAWESRHEPTPAQQRAEYHDEVL